MLQKKWIYWIVGLCLQFSTVLVMRGIFHHYQFDYLSWFSGLTPSEPEFWLAALFFWLPVGGIVETVVFRLVIGFVMKILGITNYEWEGGLVGSMVGNNVYLSRSRNNHYAHESAKVKYNSYLILCRAFLA